MDILRVFSGFHRIFVNVFCVAKRTMTRCNVFPNEVCQNITSIHLLDPLPPPALRVAKWSAGDYPSGQGSKVTLSQGPRRRTNTRLHNFGGSKLAQLRTCLWTVGGRRRTRRQPTHTNMQTPHTMAPGPRFELATFLLRGDGNAYSVFNHCEFPQTTNSSLNLEE